jgi:glycine/D-amino acid oxidase-like deaminating enzyme
MAFFEPADRALFRPGPMPVWGICPEEDGWYGHPLQREGWVKVANDLRGPTVDPDVDRAATPAFVEAAREFVARRIPALAAAPVAGTRACLYENTPDRDFVVDWAPGSDRILVAGGGSGHGFKFGGSIGPVIADALEDKPNPLGDRFRLGKRFAK